MRQGTTYYLSPSGDDTHPGTSPARPWKTLARASEATLQPGDRLALQGRRTFEGTLNLSERHSGTAERLVRIGSYGRGRATIAAGMGSGIVMRNTSGICLQNLHIVGVGRAAGNVEDGILIQVALPTTTQLDTLIVERVEVEGFGLAGLSLTTSAVTGGRCGYRNIRLSRVDAHDNADAGIDLSGSYSDTLSGYAHKNVTITRCRAWHNRGIAGKGSHSGNGIVVGQIDGSLIEHCEAFGNGENSNSAGGGPVGIWAWDSTRIVIQHCKSHDNRSTGGKDGGGFDLDGGVTHSVMRYNESRNNDGAGFLVYQFEGARPAHDNLVHDNVSINDGRTNLAGLYVGGGMGSVTFRRNRVHVSPSTEPDAHPAAAGVDDYDNGEVIFEDNRFVVEGGVPAAHIAPGKTPVRFRRNRYTLRGASLAALWRGTPYSTVAAWRAATGQERA